MSESLSFPARPELSPEVLALRSALADEVKALVTRVGHVGSAPTYWGGVDDVLMLLRGADPEALKAANVAKRKERLGW